MIWNFILLTTFLVSGTFGIILAIIVSYRIRLSFYSDLLFWHVEMSISMAIISIFHIRIFLLVLIVLITLIVMIFVVIPRYPSPQDIIRLFLYVDVHLILLMLFTYLPFFRKLKPAAKS